MSTRQLRLSGPVQIAETIATLVGKKVSIVLTDNTAMAGELTTATQDHIYLVNMRLKKIQYPLKDIAEIYYDTNL